ncbi:MAG: porin [Hyphomicrobiales bacterium]|nr:porin [Hyphomicrobiales bacterium]
MTVASVGFTISVQAADLPAKKAAPAATPASGGVVGCPAFGSGFFNLPGTETCLKIGGYFRYLGYVQTPDTGATNAAYSQAGRIRQEFDVRSNSELGMIRGFTRITDVTAERAFVQIGTLTAGAYGATTDIAGLRGETFGALFNDGTNVTGIKYEMPMGTSTLTFALENAKDFNNGSGVSDRPDALLGFKTKLGTLDANIIGVNHHITTSSAEAEGFALLGALSTKVGSVDASVFGGVSKGASRYTFSTSSSSTTMPPASSTISGWVDSIANGSDEADSDNVGAQLAYTEGPVTVVGQLSNANLNTVTKGKYQSQRAGFAVIGTIAKDLVVEPGVVMYNNINSGDAVTTTRAYLQIKRSF